MGNSDLVMSVIEHIDRKFTHLEDKLDAKFAEIDTRVKDVETSVQEAKVKSRLIGKLAAIAGTGISVVVSMLVSNWEAIVATIVNSK